ncbi:MAG: hypothetical protein AW09_004627 [Candidatus Accumulibacter phosphatis]|uniref:Uncharacterized protein n=1 Tax=Candidatus Accumulibacter phosphatis TaxID=327160 RepID=A0A084Y6E1_9PROT|nr:MAG: hypothetical protein AW09_004627 [Candidatus Accumulibacter phosphatis]
MLGGDPADVRRNRFLPKLVANDLQVKWFDNLQVTLDYGAIAGALAHGSEFLDKPLDSRVVELDTSTLGGLADRPFRCWQTQQLQAEMAGQPGRQQVTVAIECRAIFLTHGKQRPYLRVAQRFAQLLEERHLVLVVLIRGQDLLELVEDQKLEPRITPYPGALRQVRSQSNAGDFGKRRFALWLTVLAGGDDACDEGIAHVLHFTGAKVCSGTHDG